MISNDRGLTKYMGEKEESFKTMWLWKALPSFLTSIKPHYLGLPWTPSLFFLRFLPFLSSSCKRRCIFSKFPLTYHLRDLSSPESPPSLPDWEPSSLSVWVLSLVWVYNDSYWESLQMDFWMTYTCKTKVKLQFYSKNLLFNVSPLLLFLKS